MTLPSASPDLQSALQLSLGSAYTLERELTGGGMSRVFVASDRALGRRVVVKVLAPDLAEGISLERFEREIRLLASLQQANIVPLLSAGRTGTLPYYTMPFVEGRSIRDRIEKEGPLSIGEATNILRDVARALLYAHAHGIVHRDIKPDNILLSGDTAVVADFGIAKALSAARTNVEHTLTQTGLGIGTPAYMAPEQAVGDPDVDHRADIYAFGCVAYEVLSGKSPFAGRKSHLIVAAHLTEIPVAVSVVRAGIPPALCTLVTKCLQKDPAHRPQNARELIQALDAAVISSVPTTLPLPNARTMRPAVVTTSSVALAVAVAAFFLWRAVVANSEPASLAVLPFLNVGGDSLQEYLADGIRDELATAIGKVPGIQLTGRSAAFQYHGRRDIDVRQAGYTLGARYLLQGTLRQSGGHLSVSTVLSDSAGGKEVWSDQFERQAADLPFVRDSIVRAIANNLHKPLAREKTIANREAQSAASDSNHLQAYDLYLRGEYLLQRRGPGVVQSIGNFEKAIAKDDHFARAYAGLSAALVLVPFFDGTLPKDLYARATNAAHRALAIDNGLAEAHTALAMVYFNDTQPDSAEVEFQRAVAAEPNNVAAHTQYGRFLIETGQAEAARRELTRALQIDPLAVVTLGWQSYCNFLSGDLPQALVGIDRAFQIDSTILSTVNFGGLLYLAAGNRSEAVRRMRLLPDGVSMANTPYVYAAAGDTAAAFNILRTMESRQPQPWFTDVVRATIMLAIGDTARALDALELSASRSGNMWREFIPVYDPAYDALRRTPRFAALLRNAKMNTSVFLRERGGRKG